MWRIALANLLLIALTVGVARAQAPLAPYADSLSAPSSEPPYNPAPYNSPVYNAPSYTPSPVPTPAGTPGGRQDPTTGLFNGGSCCYQWPLYTTPTGLTYFVTEAVAFRRDWQRTSTIETLNTPTTPALRSSDLNFVSQPGLSLMAGRKLNGTFALEAGFLGLLKWDETRAISNLTPNSQGTLGNLFSPFSHFGNPGLLGFDYNTFASIRTESEFNTAEINLRQRFDTAPSSMQASGIYGFRYINVHEQFQYRSLSNSPAGGTLNAVNVDTHNGLFGVQAGGTAEFQVAPRGWFNIELKGFMCRNGAKQNTAFTTGPAIGPGLTSLSEASNSRVALGADVSLSLKWRFWPHVLGNLGYQGIFVDGLALGADNFVRNAPFITTGPATVYRNGHLAFHGPFAGLTATW